jgi:hypothetical protein
VGSENPISDRRPALFDDKYDNMHRQRLKEYEEAKEQWLGESTMVWGNKGSATSRCWSSPAGSVVENDIEALRERGKMLQESLREDYEMKRAVFQHKQREQGDISGFQRRLERLRKAEAEEALQRANRRNSGEKVQERQDFADLKKHFSLKG